jgi:hypothetical protein
MQIVPKPQIFVVPEDKLSNSDSDKSEESDVEEKMNKITIKMRSTTKWSRKGSEDIMLGSGSFSNIGSKTPFKTSFKSLAVFGGNQNDQKDKIQNLDLPDSVLPNSEIKLDTVNEDRNDFSLIDNIQPDNSLENEYKQNFRSGYKMVTNLPHKLSSECNITEHSHEGVIDRN